MKNVMIVLASLFALSSFANDAAVKHESVKHESHSKTTAVKKGKKGEIKKEMTTESKEMVAPAAAPAAVDSAATQH